MKNTNFKLNSVLLAMLVATQATAQDESAAESNDVEVIQVTGIASSLTKSAALKRDGTGVVDAISAEDIGKFPDTNLAESLQRITGVSIDRVNNEGNQVTVRGFGPSFNLVTLNGRQMPNSSALASAGISRSFNFNEVGSESVSAVEVFKTGRADINSGGIGATININTLKPFDFDGFTALASVKGVVDTSVETGSSVTPEISGMVSDTFLDDTFGVLLSLSHAVRDSHTDRIGTSGNWSTGYPGQVAIDKSAIDTSLNPDQNTWGVPTVDLDSQNTERTRQNAQLVLQWAPTDSLVASVDYTLSRLDINSSMNRTSFWFDNIETGTADVNGTIINPARQNDELNFWAWEYAYETENDSIGLNLEWQATDSLSFTFDVHNSTSHANPGALPAESIANLKNPFGAAAPVHIAADFSGNIPSVSYDDSALPGGAFDLANIEGDLYQERGYEIKNTIQQVQLGGTWELENDFGLQAVHFGVSNTNYDVDTKNIYGANFGLGNGAMDISELDLSFSPGAIGFEQRSSYSADQFLALVREQGLLNEKGISTNGIEEATTAAYVSVDFETELASMIFKANLGVRYESTDVTSYSIENPVVGFNWITPLEMSKIRAADSQSSELEGDYTNTLPSMNLSLEITDDLVTRLSYSTTISRSNIDAMFPATSLNNHFSGGPFRASQGNPSLLPFESDNLDLSLEYYYGEGSYVSAGYYRKEVDNFIGIGEEDRTISGPDGVLTDPSVNPRGTCPDGSVANPNPDCVSQPGDPAIVWEVTTPINQDSTTVDGWELNVQHMFGDSGFGGIANYTIANTDDEYNPYSLTNDFAVTGLSDSANLVAFYEKDAISVRIAYNWRDDFLLSGGVSPVFTEAYSQIDMSASYDINDALSVFVDGINITNESTRRHGRFANQIVDFEEYGARYSVGVRAKF
ncbi:TonB-dependent receptor [Thalassotalea agarivorans]|uniref:TonB-dependent receptor n=1 Tax=Thalassotalea agarivorans TaxID=349064 RepID=A0A1I0AVB3_THASX|nr:TonB-dependent receptor [Thalassotalea agarivorans]SES97497.1 TonB-dependent receptor [Thalassotalea agarivorans]